jgi:putative oxidoreductase
MKASFLIGRLVFGGYFLYNGINHLKQRQMLSQYAGAKQVPKPDVAVVVSAVPLLIGGASILLGVKPKFGAAAIAAFLAGVSPIMHDFWRAEDPNQRINDMNNFIKNMALLGAALALIGVEEPWPASIPVPKRDVIDRVRKSARSLTA